MDFRDDIGDLHDNVLLFQRQNLWGNWNLSDYTKHYWDYLSHTISYLKRHLELHLEEEIGTKQGPSGIET